MVPALWVLPKRSQSVMQIGRNTGGRQLGVLLRIAPHRFQYALEIFFPQTESLF